MVRLHLHGRIPPDGLKKFRNVHILKLIALRSVIEFIEGRDVRQKA